MRAWQITREQDELRICGDLRTHDATDLWRQLKRATRDAVPPRLDLDVAKVSRADGNAIALIVAIRTSLMRRGVRCEIVGASSDIHDLLRLFRGDQPPPPLVGPRATPHVVVRLGAATAKLLRLGHTTIVFLGEVAASVGRLFVRPTTGNWRAVPTLIVRAGTDGIPIVVLLTFLMGFVMAFQTSEQLELYGANIYVADVVGISILRELGPLMTAIIMTGRSGAAFAAELATMRVSEEVDALRTLGISPVPYLVVPRIIALAITAPLLTLLGDIVGVIGGLVVAAMSLDVTPTAYITELRTTIVPSDLWTGIVKSVAFGVAIALIGCQQGLAARGAASGVGRRTTTTVVNCLFTIVILDTLFTVLFRAVRV